jgi:hypothetical protein
MKNDCVGVFLRRKKKLGNQLFLGIFLKDFLKFTDFVQKDTMMKYTYIAVVFIIRDVVSRINISPR